MVLTLVSLDDLSFILSSVLSSSFEGLQPAFLDWMRFLSARVKEVKIKIFI